MISAIVVSHGHREELAESLPALAPQVDGIVLVANVPGSLPDDTARCAADRERNAARLCRQPEPRHRGDDRRARPGQQPGRRPRARRRRRRSPRSWTGTPAAGSPARVSSTPTARGSRPGGAFRRRRHARPSDAAPPRLPAARAPARALRPRRAADGAGRGRLDARRLAAPSPLDARRARRLRRRLPDVRRGDRPLLPRCEGGLGALVRPAGGRPPPLGRAHRPDASWTRRTLWHWRSILRFVRKHPERLFAR